jgi:hypothetical protein
MAQEIETAIREQLMPDFPVPEAPVVAEAEPAA